MFQTPLDTERTAAGFIKFLSTHAKIPFVAPEVPEPDPEVEPESEEGEEGEGEPEEEGEEQFEEEEAAEAVQEEIDLKDEL
jgi:hypothetical protein